MRLLKAAVHVFADSWRSRGVDIDALARGFGFELSYDTNIPRQSGLSGSSALVWATLQCLSAFYRLPLHADDASSGAIARYRAVAPAKEELPTLVLSAEQRLGIAAGLQDRVIQVYGGVVHMDFDASRMAEPPVGAGEYTPLPKSRLPPLFLIVANAASDSGRTHSDLRVRWERGDTNVRAAMAEVASLADSGRALLLGEEASLSWPSLFRRNFALRRQMFGESALGAQNLRMVDLAESHGFAAKFCGSGGAAVCTYDTSSIPLGDLQGALERLKRSAASENMSVEQVEVVER